MGRKWIINFFVGAILYSGCNYQSEKDIRNISQRGYYDNKREFDTNIVKHFPKELQSDRQKHINSKIDSKNDLGFYLYEYEVKPLTLQKLRKKIEKSALAHYQTTDTLILVVNRFETLKTDYERTIPKIKDSTYLDSSLFVGLYPVPNFIGYEKPVKTKNGIWLPQGYDLYVLEAKSGDYCNEFDLKENFQMPKGWKNGFSRGVAISEKDKTVIYWGILW